MAQNYNLINSCRSTIFYSKQRCEKDSVYVKQHSQPNYENKIMIVKTDKKLFVSHAYKLHIHTYFIILQGMIF